MMTALLAHALAYPVNCGDGFQDPDEECDDGTRTLIETCPYGSTLPCVVCSDECEHVDGLITYCGNGTIDPNGFEACDPVVPDNTCTATCQGVCDAGLVVTVENAAAPAGGPSALVFGTVENNTEVSCPVVFVLGTEHSHLRIVSTTLPSGFDEIPPNTEVAFNIEVKLSKNSIGTSAHDSYTFEILNEVAGGDTVIGKVYVIPRGEHSLSNVVTPYFTKTVGPVTFTFHYAYGFRAQVEPVEAAFNNRLVNEQFTFSGSDSCYYIGSAFSPLISADAARGSGWVIQGNRQWGPPGAPLTNADNVGLADQVIWWYKNDAAHISSDPFLQARVLSGATPPSSPRICDVIYNQEMLIGAGAVGAGFHWEKYASHQLINALVSGGLETKRDQLLVPVVYP